MNNRRLKTTAVLCIVVVVFTAFLPAASVTLAPVILTALWLVIPAVVVTVVCRKAVRCDEQPISLLSLVSSRAPPITLPLA